MPYVRFLRIRERDYATAFFPIYYIFLIVCSNGSFASIGGSHTCSSADSAGDGFQFLRRVVPSAFDRCAFIEIKLLGVIGPDQVFPGEELVCPETFATSRPLSRQAKIAKPTVETSERYA
jgi:hypothetical protein